MTDPKQDTVIQNPATDKLLQNGDKPQSYGTQDAKQNVAPPPPKASDAPVPGVSWATTAIDPTSAEAKKKPFLAARGNIQRVVDVTLIITNMAHLARIFENEDHYTDAQFGFLVGTLIVAMICQIIAGICFYVVIARKEDAQLHGTTDRVALEDKHWWDYLAIAMVGMVMILNIIVNAFDAIWAKKIEQYPGQNYMTLANGTVALVQPGPNGTFSLIPKTA